MESSEFSVRTSRNQKPVKLVINVFCIEDINSPRNVVILAGWSTCASNVRERPDFIEILVILGKNWVKFSTCSICNSPSHVNIGVHLGEWLWPILKLKFRCCRCHRYLPECMEIDILASNGGMVMVRQAVSIIVETEGICALRSLFLRLVPVKLKMITRPSWVTGKVDTVI